MRGFGDVEKPSFSIVRGKIAKQPIAGLGITIRNGRIATLANMDVGAAIAVVVEPASSAAGRLRHQRLSVFAVVIDMLKAGQRSHIIEGRAARAASIAVAGRGGLGWLC